jgi:peptide chain release factor 2
MINSKKHVAYLISKIIAKTKLIENSYINFHLVNKINLRIKCIDASKNYYLKKKKSTRELSKKTKVLIAFINCLKKKIIYFIELIGILNKYDVDCRIIRNDLLDIQVSLNYIITQCILDKKVEHHNAILTINAGQGGVDSQDFSHILLKMYRYYLEKCKFKIEILDVQYGEEIGIKSITINVIGKYAYGYLISEIGVHRLVRISPFDTNTRRHTSFCSVWVTPTVKLAESLCFDSKDLRIDTFRARGAGGQHVNKTESAVRIIHIPTKITAVCQSERSQAKNKIIALKSLKYKLYVFNYEKNVLDKDLHEKIKQKASFGSQIRNYILFPYKSIKDTRTATEVLNVNSILSGNIDIFVISFLFWKKI